MLSHYRRKWKNKVSCIHKIIVVVYYLFANIYERLTKNTIWIFLFFIFLSKDIFYITGEKITFSKNHSRYYFFLRRLQKCFDKSSAIQSKGRKFYPVFKWRFWEIRCNKCFRYLYIYISYEWWHLFKRNIKIRCN